ncbi:MAG: CPBP family intramembrane metalloprotease [Methylacidiphilales bacterium]|nr:CPBP family intramembrane metalloprotease [Candidatus Methylacidiphilales bacterium]
MALLGKNILLVFFLILLPGAAILGPILYFALSPIFPIPFHRAMDRALLICAVLALALFASRIPFSKLWPFDNSAWKQLLLGYLLAAVTIQTAIAFDYAFCGFTSAHLNGHQATSRILLAVIAAILIPPLEETIFRGFLQGEFTRSLGWRGGLFIAAVVYMLAHFLKIPAGIDHQPVHLWSGVTALGAMFAHFGESDFFIGNLGKALNLLLLGLIFGGAFLRAGTLWLNAGLHSGLILGLLIFTGFTRPDVPPRVDGLDGDMISSPVTGVVLVLLGLWLWRFYRHPSVLPETGANAP